MATTGARWEAAVPRKAQGISLTSAHNARFTIGKQSRMAVARVAPVADYYQRAGFVMRVDRVPAKAAWLTVEYLDKGYGLICLCSAGGMGQEQLPITARDQWGVARVNSGTLRRAWFKLEPAALTRSIRICGLDYLHALWLSDIEPEREPVPGVAPLVRLRRAMELPIGELAYAGDLVELRATMQNLLPLARVLGFNSVESYVTWGGVEHEQGVFDWTRFDTVIEEAGEYGVQWFPVVVVGSAYTLPQWFHDGPDHLGFECLEHHQRTEIQSFFVDTWPKYVQKFLKEFGRHYDPGDGLQGMRTGVTGTYGEPLYPADAGANMGYRGQPFHSHDGYWAGGPEVQASFRGWLRARYRSIANLNKAWQGKYRSFDALATFLPGAARNPRQRLDFFNWYLDAMSDFTERWGQWCRQALPRHPSVYQSVGGIDRVRHGSDFVRLTKDAARSGIGIRATNEGDDYALNFGLTRLLSSAARFYGTRFGLEPAGDLTARGVVARIFNAIVSGADHLFYYARNLMGNDQAIDTWLTYAPLLDQRADPLIDVAVLYSNTANKLDESIWTEPWSPFYSRVYALRSVTDYDLAGEQMILDGALDQYKVLIVLWGDTTEKPVLDRIGRWVGTGGTLMTPLTLRTVEGDTSMAQGWEEGRTGKGRVIRYRGVPWSAQEYYMSFLRRQLRSLSHLRPQVGAAVRIDKPETVYCSVLKNGNLALLNFDDEPAQVRFDGRTLRLEPYSIVVESLAKRGR